MSEEQVLDQVEEEPGDEIIAKDVAEEEEADADADLSADDEVDDRTWKQKYEAANRQRHENDMELDKLRTFKEVAEPVLETLKESRKEPERTAPAGWNDENGLFHPYTPAELKALPYANKKYAAMIAQGEDADYAKQKAWEYGHEAVEIATAAAAEARSALHEELGPIIERSGSGAMAEDVQAILTEAGITDVPVAEIMAEFTGMTAAKWSEGMRADKAGLSTAVVVAAKAKAFDKIQEGTLVPKGKAKPDAPVDPRVGVPQTGGRPVMTAEMAAYRSQLEQQGITLEPKQFSSAFARYQSKKASGGKW